MEPMVSDALIKKKLRELETLLTQAQLGNGRGKETVETLAPLWKEWEARESHKWKKNTKITNASNKRTLIGESEEEFNARLALLKKSPRHCRWAKRAMGLTLTIDGKKKRLAEMPWSQCTREIGDIISDHLGATINRQGHVYSVCSRNRIVGTLQAMLSDSYDSKKISHHPMAGWKRKKERGRQGIFTDEQHGRFCAALPPIGSRLHRFMKLMGTRRDEARLLQKHEIDWDTKCVVLPAERTKTGVPRVIPMPAEIEEMIREQLSVIPGTYLFPNPRDPKGGPIPKGTLHSWNVKARERTQMRLFGEAPTNHHNRHTWATNVTADGMPITAIGDIGGWSDLGQLKRYAKTTGAVMENARQIMGGRSKDSEPQNHGDRPGPADPRCSPRRAPPSLTPASRRRRVT